MQFAQLNGVLVATQEGLLSKYFRGVDYSPEELRPALVESSEGQIGSATDEPLFYCFHYDPESGCYGLAVINLFRFGGVIPVFVDG